MSDRPKPTDIVLHTRSHSLEIVFDNGARFDLPCELLRVYSPSAEVRGHWGQYAKLQLDKQDVNITKIQPVGAYAIKIFFDDGHDSGLYDWDFLYDLGHKQSLHWNDYLQRLSEAGHRRKEPSWRSSLGEAD
jgi:DUF971 family protein